MKRGCDVVYESMYEVHVSGHACQEELKLVHGLTKPKFFIPVHGEQKHLHKHARLAESMGMPRQNIYIGDIGDVVELNEDFMHPLAPVPAGRVLWTAWASAMWEALCSGTGSIWARTA